MGVAGSVLDLSFKLTFFHMNGRAFRAKQARFSEAEAPVLHFILRIDP
jgi:hypothetical protein